MARDYKSRANPGPKKQQTSGWTWFSAGLLVGLFTAGLIWLKFASPANNPQAPPQAEASKPKQATIKPKQVQKPLPTKPNFEFYTVLPEMEVVVPEPLPDLKNGTKKASAPVVSRTLPAAGTAYMLQMGSFRKHTDADRMKARLALLGIETEIQKVPSITG